MSPYPSGENPSRSRFLLQRAVFYVRQSALLRATVALTLADYVLLVLMTVAGRISPSLATLLAALSFFTWAFALGLVFMYREVLSRSGSERAKDWGWVAAVFGRVALYGQTALFSYMVLYAAMARG